MEFYVVVHLLLGPGFLPSHITKVFHFFFSERNESGAGSLGGASQYATSSLTTWSISELDATESAVESVDELDATESADSPIPS
jgi:hypothetical protein